MKLLKYCHSLQYVGGKKTVILTYSAKHRIKWILRPVICDVIKNSQTPDVGIPAFQALIEPGHSIFFRLTWFLIIAICFSGCCFQIIDRIQLLLSYPSGVDIAVNDITHYVLPGIKLCTGANAYVREHLDPKNKIECALPILPLLRHDNVSYEEIWKSDGQLPTYQSHEFLTKVVINNIPITNETTFLGRCTVFAEDKILRGRELLAVLKINLLKSELCDESIQLLTIKDKIDFRIVLAVIGNSALSFKIGARKYFYLNTPREPCTSSAEFAKCYDKCIIRRLSTETNCRLPYFDSAIKLPDCTNSSSAIATYFATASIFTKGGLLDKCGCKETCDSTRLVILPNLLPSYKNGSAITIESLPQEIVLTEFLAYDFPDLLTDIGGSLGLFLGLSVLAILNIVYVGMTILKTKLIKTTQSWTPVEQLVTAKTMEILQITRGTCKKNLQTNDARIIKLLRLIITVLCVSLAIFMIQERVRYYFTYPIRRIVKVDVDETITFPSYTICGLANKIGLYAKTYAKAKAKANNVSEPDICDVSLYDLIQMKPAQKLWDASETLAVDSRLVQDIAMNTFGVSLMRANYTSLPTHLGTCSHYAFDGQPYAGFFTVFLLAFQPSKLDTCRNNIFTVFYDDPGSEFYNILSAIENPTSSYSYYDYRLSRVSRIDSKQRPCTDETIFKQCKENCLLDQLKRVTLCNLPFLPQSLNITTECDVITAKRTGQKFAEISTGVTLGTTCHCVNPCKENYLTISPFSQVQETGSFFVMAFVMFSNIVETVKEVEKYSTIALFSDIGNSLGLALGISALTAAQILRQIFQSLRNKFNDMIVKTYPAQKVEEPESAKIEKKMKKVEMNETNSNIQNLTEAQVT